MCYTGSEKIRKKTESVCNVLHSFSPVTVPFVLWFIVRIFEIWYKIEK